MGFYLNSNKPASLYKSETQNPYFVDKTRMLEELIPLVEQRKKYICITRPRRFGKTIAANMIGAFFGKNDKGEMFDSLQISQSKKYKEHRNQHNVIYITCNEVPDVKPSYASYIGRIKKRLIKDLRKNYPQCDIDDEEVDMLYERYKSKTKFPSVTREGLQEWYDGYKFVAKTP